MITFISMQIRAAVLIELELSYPFKMFDGTLAPNVKYPHRATVR